MSKSYVTVQRQVRNSSSNQWLVVRTVSVHTAGGLCRMRLNYDGNVLGLNSCAYGNNKEVVQVVGATSNEGVLVCLRGANFHRNLAIIWCILPARR